MRSIPKVGVSILANFLWNCIKTEKNRIPRGSTCLVASHLGSVTAKDTNCFVKQEPSCMTARGIYHSMSCPEGVEGGTHLMCTHPTPTSLNAWKRPGPETRDQWAWYHPLLPSVDGQTKWKHVPSYFVRERWQCIPLVTASLYVTETYTLWVELPRRSSCWGLRCNCRSTQCDELDRSSSFSVLKSSNSLTLIQWTDSMDSK